MPHPIQLIVGLGNPGSEYANTRHNAGAWFVELLAEQTNTTLRFETKFKGNYARIHWQGQECHLLVPTTFMNLSGQAIAATAKFFKIPAANILVAHDELDLPVGTIRLKSGGGHGGHNGLRDTMAHFGAEIFQRLRIGIGHPGNAKQVIDYVLKNPSRADHELIMQAINDVLPELSDILSGNLQKAMKNLHTIK